MSTMTAAVRTPGSDYTHEADHGFCIICGGVWPCARADSANEHAVVPIARLTEGSTASV
jgi:hypothetical protein